MPLRRRFIRLDIWALGLSLAGGLAGCQEPGQPPSSAMKSEVFPVPSRAAAFRVTGVTLGRGVDSDRKIVSPGKNFAPDDTIYASVRTMGAMPATRLSARWSTRKGEASERLSERDETVTLDGAGTSIFRFSRPGGIDPGGYRLDLFADGVVVAQADFRVDPASTEMGVGGSGDEGSTP